MNYTEKYHLPQWEETDRVMRTDFNAAMAGIEEGLNEANDSAASADAAAEARALARLRKLGYDLCQTAARSAATGASLGHAKGLVYNGLTTETERAKTSGLYLPEGSSGVWLGPQTGLTLGRLNAKILDQKTGNRDQYPRPFAQLTFHSVGKGIITKLKIRLVQSSLHYFQPKVIVRCYDLAANTCVYDSGEQTLDMVQTISSDCIPTVSVPIDADRDYRLEAEITGPATCTGTYGFGSESAQSLLGEITPILYTSGTVSGSLSLESPACMALAVIHYTGGDTIPTAKVKNQAMTPTASRQTTSARGVACTEQEYLLEGSWSGNVALSAAFQSTNQNLTIHDIEWYLI